MPLDNNFSQADEIQQMKQLLENNTNTIKGMEASLKKINNYMKWQYIFAIFKIIVIVIPLILGFIFLPPLLKNIVAPYQELLGSINEQRQIVGNVNNVMAINNIDVNTFLAELAK